MNSILYPYFYSGPGESFEKLGHLFESSIINNTITIPEKRGIGQIRKIDVINGLQLHLWDIKLHDDLRLQRAHAPSAGKNMLSLFYVFSTEHSVLTHVGSTSSADTSLKSIVLASEEVKLDFYLKAWQPIRMIQADINMTWLIEELAKSVESPCAAYDHLLGNMEPFLFTDTASFDMFHAFSNLQSHISRETIDPFYLKTKTLSLLCDIFRLSGKQLAPVLENSTVMREKMQAVEKILDESLETTLPSISAIAKQMALSESTLKRNFKQLYGTSIYEYYLQKKMRMARQLFAERPVPVKEVAYRLGYEKVSNFIQMFKKYYHFSPGRLKKASGLIENTDKVML